MNGSRIKASPRIFWSSYGITNKNSGIGNIAYHLNQALIANQVVPTLLGNKPREGFDRNPYVSAGPIVNGLSRFKFLAADAAFFRIWRSATGEPAVVHGLANFNVPIFLSKPMNFRFFITVHDLIPLIAPSQVSPSLALQFSKVIARAFERAERVISVSAWTARTILERFPQTSSRLVIIPHGVDSMPRLSSNGIGSSRPIDVIFVARYERYKGFDLFAKLVQSSPKNRVFYAVTDIKGERFLSQNCGEAIRSNRLKIGIAVTPEVLTQIYSMSKILLMTSVYEGYGLPFAEASAQGCQAIWRKGLPMDELAKPDSGVALEYDSNSDVWKTALDELLNAWTPAVPEAVLSTITDRPTWDQAAKKLISLYNS